MMGRRRKARELATQILFHMEFSPGSPDEVFKLICQNFDSSESIRVFSRELVCGVCDNREYLDEKIRQSSKNWRLERMSRVDRSILRLGAFELLFLKEIPPKVSIDEAVELGKRFGSEDSGAFINGVLDNIFNNMKSEEPISDEEK
jgi:transcription antitermination factor NusB